jgi:hypothetical protein
MRFLLVILLIALLPLRSWASESMALHMAVADISAVQTSADVAQMPPDCPMLVSPEKAKAGCSSCHLCMALGVFEFTVAGSAPFTPQHLVSVNAYAFRSAALNQAIKPPIFRT